jgi:hypothetical protein
MEYGVFVTDDWLENIIRHCLTVNVLRHDFETSLIVLVLHLQLFTRKHSGLKNDGHCLSGYQTIGKI